MKYKKLIISEGKKGIDNMIWEQLKPPEYTLKVRKAGLDSFVHSILLGLCRLQNYYMCEIFMNLALVLINI